MVKKKTGDSIDLARSQVLRDIEELKAEAAEYGASSFRSGKWFLRAIRKVLARAPESRRHALRRRFPDLAKGTVAQKIVAGAARKAGVAGGITGGVVHASSVLSLFTFGSGLAAGVAAVLGEMVYILRMQVGMALDIAAIHQVAVDPDNPTELVLLLASAMGVSTKKLGVRALTGRHLDTRSPMVLAKVAQRVGVTILQRNVLKYALPVACIAISTGLNYYRTRKIGKMACKYYDREREIRSVVGTEFPAGRHNEERILLPLVFAMAKADGVVDERESQVFRQCLDAVRPHMAPEEWDYIARMIKADRNTLLDEVKKVRSETMQRALLDILDLTMRIDGEIHPDETRLFSQISRCFRGEDPFAVDQDYLIAEG